MTKVFTKPASFYEVFERKGGPNPEDTHYCPGCGHGTVHKLVAECIDDLAVRDRTVFISPVGCSVFAYYYFDTGNIQAAHGRAPAVATGVKRARPDSIVISYQGDGDLAAIGLNNILQAANRGELITVFFINNAIYGMTGGQMAPTTVLGQRTTTTPRGRSAANASYPLRMCARISTLEAPVYVERVSLATPKLTMKARKAVRRALQCQVDGKGFAFVEILSQCPTGWKMTAEDSHKWIEEHLTPVFPLGVYKDAVSDAEERQLPRTVPTPDSIRAAVYPGAVAGGNGGGGSDASRAAAPQTFSVKVAGFGGQGVLYLGEVLAATGMLQGLQVSWLPPYVPAQRGGTAHCHVNQSACTSGPPVV